ncbi:MAG: hypothetical protein GF331_11675 [Chitinivibrionales bacterium]|nr:hypothetical protein [Chitinivibrionales bacterium]
MRFTRCCSAGPLRSGFAAVGRLLLPLILIVWPVSAASEAINGRPGNCGALGYDELPRYRVLAIAMPNDSSDIMVRRESATCLLGRIPGNAIMAQYVGGSLYLGSTSSRRSCGGAVSLTQIRRYDSSLRGTVLLTTPLQGFLVAAAQNMLAVNACSTVQVLSIDGDSLYSVAHGSIDQRLGSGLQSRVRLVQWSTDQRTLWGYVLEHGAVLAVFVIDTDTWKHTRYNVEGRGVPASCALDPTSADLAYATSADNPSMPPNDEKRLHDLYVLDLESGQQHTLGQLYGTSFWARWVEPGMVEFVEETQGGAKRRIAVE